MLVIITMNFSWVCLCCCVKLLEVYHFNITAHDKNKCYITLNDDVHIQITDLCFTSGGLCRRQLCAGCVSANSKHRFTISFLPGGRCRKAMFRVWCEFIIRASLSGTSKEGCRKPMLGIWCECSRQGIKMVCYWATHNRTPGKQIKVCFVWFVGIRFVILVCYYCVIILRSLHCCFLSAGCWLLMTELIICSLIYWIIDRIICFVIFVYFLLGLCLVHMLSVHFSYDKNTNRTNSTLIYFSIFC